ncbi:hypothetical protein BH10BAC2_BH10BAC2_31360 [soil metagenome]
MSICFVICQPWSLCAQLCDGNLGEPIVNITFGNHANPYKFPSSATTYKPAGGCPNKGEYIISGFIFGCGNNTWIPMTGDHYFPGNEGGSYMMVNAAGTPGTIYTDTVRELCGNTTYQLAGWITNVMQDITCGGKASLPNIIFAIENLSGVELASYSSGFIPIENAKVWKQYGITVKTPANTNAVILRIKTTPNPMDTCDYGSAFAIDDITFNQCGPLVEATIDGKAGPANVCADYTDPFILNATYTDGYTDPAVQWQNSFDTGKTWIDIAGATTTTYAVPKRQSGVILYHMVVAERANVNSVNCRTSSNPIYTEIHPVPLHNPPQNILGCTGKDYSLPITDPKALAIEWAGPNGYKSTAPVSVVPDLQDNDTGLYRLKQSFYFGCVSVDTFYLKVFPGTTLTVQPAVPVCEGKSQQLLATASDAATFQWTPSAGLSNDKIPNPIAAPLDSTNYKLVITNSYGCKDSAFLQIDVYRKPVVNAGPDKIILVGDTTSLSAVLRGTALDYSWTPSQFMSNNRLVNPLVYPNVSTSYTLSANSTVGCGFASDEVLVKVYTNIAIPNAFTPNGDGRNDVFRVVALDSYKLTGLIIYNRWGQLLFRAVDSYRGWDGTVNGIPQPQGSYVYHLEMQAPSGKKIISQGFIVLIR